MVECLEMVFLTNIPGVYVYVYVPAVEPEDEIVAPFVDPVHIGQPLTAVHPSMTRMRCGYCCCRPTTTTTTTTATSNGAAIATVAQSRGRAGQPTTLAKKGRHPANAHSTGT